MSKVWRLIFTILATVPVVMLGWFAADSALRFFAVDQELGPVFTPMWVKVVYRMTYLVAGIVLGVALGRAIFRQLEAMGERLQKMSVRDKVAIGGGLVIGITLSAIVSLPVIFSVGTTSKLMAVALTLFIAVLVTYLCTIAAMSMKEELHFYMPQPAEEEKLPEERFKILDTNVIIDGRIADIAKAGFVEGHLYVPGFVLEELQHIADSADGLKRARGRRGLDILRTMQIEQELTVRRYDKLAPPGEAVDTRLVRLAKALNGAIVTNDYNLNKVAQLEGVPILNVNELANAVKPVVLLVSTPAFCQTAICGPVLELLVDRSEALTDRATVIHAEVYTDDTASETSSTVDALGLRYEPSLFVAAADGTVRRRLDYTFDAVELDDALAATAS